MKALADALVRAVTYSNCLPDPHDEQVDEEVHMLEEMATFLADATDEEKDALAAAAQHAFGDRPIETMSSILRRMAPAAWQAASFTLQGN